MNCDKVVSFIYLEIFQKPIFFSALQLLALSNESNAHTAENNYSVQLRTARVINSFHFLMKMELISFFFNIIKEYVVSNEKKTQPEKKRAKNSEHNPSGPQERFVFSELGRNGPMKTNQFTFNPNDQLKGFFS